jgi:hypothetical protein
MNDSELQRFAKHVFQDPVTGCWEYDGYHDKKGYAQGRYTDPKTGRVGTQLMHRVSYAHFNGEIIGDNQVDHTCQNEGCCNPFHLEQVTMLENLLRKYAVANMPKLFTIYWVKSPVKVMSDAPGKLAS